MKSKNKILKILKMKKFLTFLLIFIFTINVFDFIFLKIFSVRAINKIDFSDNRLNKEKLSKLKFELIDNDKDKIFDELERMLEGNNDQEKSDVIVILNKPAKEVNKKISEFKNSLGDFDVSDTYEIVSGFSGKLTKKQITELAKFKDILQIEPDVEVKAHLNTATYWFGVQKSRNDFNVNGDGDGNPSLYTKDDIVIAIIDTGIDSNHKDLNQGKVIGWKDFVNNRSTPYDDNGHGTHVASIAAGEGEANPSFAGVAPRSALVGVKVLNSSGSGSLSRVLSGINWVVTNKNAFGIEIVNLSLGTSGCSDGTDSLSQAVNNAVAQGLIVTVSAGNSGPGTCTIGSPAAARDAVTVGAMADVGEKGFYLASFSSRGPTLDGRIKPDLIAPGVAITAAKRGTTGSYQILSGTSMSSPFVAGIIALMLDKNPALSPISVKGILTTTARDWVNQGADIDSGFGRLDGYEAVRNSNSPPSSGSNIALPHHTFISDSLPGTGAIDNWNINIVDTSYPLAISLIMPDWTSASSPDFDIRLFDQAGNLIASSLGVIRQETIALDISTTGTYRLQVDSYNGSGNYYLDISAGDQPLASDTTPPVVNISSPANGSTVSGLVTISANASDNAGVSKVDFFVDTILIATDTTSPYSITWDSKTVTNGSHTLSAKAFDQASNSATDTISVMVDNDIQPPTAPSGLTATAVSSSQIDLNWNQATDNVGVAGYKIYRDNVLINQVSTTNYSDIGLAQSTTYSYQVSALDLAGNESLKSNTATATTLTQPLSSLSVNVSSPSSIYQGDIFKVRAEITNTGRSVTTRVQATIILPAGLSTSNSLKKSVSYLLPGGTKTVSWGVNADAPGNYIITVQVSDSRGNTNQDSISLTVLSRSIID